MKKRFIILGAGRNKWTLENPSMHRLDNNKPLVNWQLITSQLLGCTRVDYIGGYDLNSLKGYLSDSIHITYNNIWDQTGPLYSFLLLDFNDNEDLFITYNDILLEDSFCQSFLSQLSSNAITCLIDTDYPNRFIKNNAVPQCETLVKDGKEMEFVGFIHIPKKLFPFLIKLQQDKESYKKHYISQLVNLTEEKNVFQISSNFEEDREDFSDKLGFGVNFIDVKGSWVDTNFSADFAKFLFKGKAKSLERIQKLTSRSQFLEQYYFSTRDWLEKGELIYQELIRKFGNILVVVRSSAELEDGFANSYCGAFDSFLEVPLAEKTFFEKAVSNTIASYGRKHNADDLVLIQPFYNTGVVHGVVFTKTHEGGPYYVFNYLLGSNTEEVTKGVSRDHKTVFVLRGTPIEQVPSLLQSTLEAVQEIESILGFFELDVEFIVDKTGNCIILQVRPQVQNKNQKIKDEEVINVVHNIKRKVNEISLTEFPRSLQDKYIFAIMPDWNPAEIIGHKPSALALSLYQELVTDETWAQQRYEFGYWDLRKVPLMHSFYGIPYVDVNRSFTSFIPRKIRSDLADVILNKSLAYLLRNPHLHDKVEFHVVPTCYTPNFRDNFKHIIDGLCEQDILSIEECYKEIVWTAVNFESKKGEYFPLEIVNEGKLSNVDCLIVNCKQGILSFAHEARRAFIAASILKSLTDINLISHEEASVFFSSLHTISQEMLNDAFLCRTGVISFEVFTNKYGHLRPGTYDITSQRYDQKIDLYLKSFVENAKATDLMEAKADFVFKRHKEIESFLRIIHPDLDYYNFINFAKDAIVAREKVKFEFSKDLSNALENIALYGELQGFSRFDMANTDLNILRLVKKSPYSDLNKQVLQTFVSENKKISLMRNCIEMPLIFSDPEEISCFSYPSIMANFVTMNSIEAERIELCLNEEQDLEEKIVFIENADPGYDWIFSKNIAGFVTMYGGINSHMAVRAAEKNIPAAIGIGPKSYNSLKKVNYILLDCKNKKLQPYAQLKNEKYFNYTEI